MDPFGSPPPSSAAAEADTGTSLRNLESVVLDFMATVDFLRWNRENPEAWVKAEEKSFEGRKGRREKRWQPLWRSMDGDAPAEFGRFSFLRFQIYLYRFLLYCSFLLFFGFWKCKWERYFRCPVENILDSQWRIKTEGMISSIAWRNYQRSPSLPFTLLQRVYSEAWSFSKSCQLLFLEFLRKKYILNFD